MNSYKYSAILSLLISLTGNATDIKKEINIPLKRIHCYGNLVRVVFQIDGHEIDFNKFPEHLGFRKCEEAIKAAENYTDAHGNLEGHLNEKKSFVNETRCFGGQYGACTELPVKLEETQFQLKTEFVGVFDYPENRAYYKYISGCSEWSRFMRCN